MTPHYSVHTDGTRYRDLNRNGVLDPFEDPRLSTAERVDDLLTRLSLEEKAGLMVQSIVPIAPGAVADSDLVRNGRPTAREFVTKRYVTHLNVHQIPDPRAMARWSNDVQRLAEETPHGIPVTLSTDPRHSFTENWGASFSAGHLSAWPEPLGLGALADAEVVREFADIARREYLALGIRSALHPTLDVSTEPRWARQYSTFGQSAEVVGRLGVAYVDGFEGGSRLGGESIACMAKHFPGGGPQRGGEDPHFPYGREQDYPGGMFDYHLEPFRRVIQRGVPAIMPSYGIPVGLTRDGERIEEVGFGFNRQILTGLLRGELGFDGVICSDWSLITESRIGDMSLPPRAWGVEHLSEIDRAWRMIDAGCDQFGGEDEPAYIVDLVTTGRLSIERIDESVRRLLRVKFDLGLFDNPFVDEDAAEQIVGAAEFTAAGHRAQATSTTIVMNGSADASPILPLTAGARIFSDELDGATVAAAGFIPVGDPEESDVIVVRLAAPFEPRNDYLLESSFHAGTLELDQDTVERVRLLAQAAPVVAVVHLERPAILAPLLSTSAAILAVFGSSDRAVLDVLAGMVEAAGALPFDVPQSTAAILAARSDVPGDTQDPLFRLGHRASTSI